MALLLPINICIVFFSFKIFDMNISCFNHVVYALMVHTCSCFFLYYLSLWFTFKTLAKVYEKQKYFLTKKKVQYRYSYFKTEFLRKKINKRNETKWNEQTSNRFTRNKTQTSDKILLYFVLPEAVNVYKIVYFNACLR